MRQAYEDYEAFLAGQSPSAPQAFESGIPAPGPDSAGIATLTQRPATQAAPIASRAAAAPVPMIDNWNAGVAYNVAAVPQDFNWQDYTRYNADLGGAGIDTEEEARRHYAMYGAAEGRRLQASTGANDWGTTLQTPTVAPQGFNWEQYLQANPDLLGSGIDTEQEALRHYAAYGQKEGRQGSGVASAAPLMKRPADIPLYPSWDSGYTPEEIELNRRQQAQWKEQYPAMLAEYNRDMSHLTPWDAANRAERTAAGAYRPELQRLPSGHLVAIPDSGAEVQGPPVASDGRIYKPYMSDDGGNTAQGALTGYELAEAKAKTPEELGLKLTPEQAAKVKGMRFYRYEKFDPSGKSLGFGYRPEDNRGFLKSVVQDLGPMIAMALPFTGLSGALASGIGNTFNLGSVASNALAGGAIGGGLSAAGGGDFIKGALAGGFGGAVSGYNPAAQLGASKAFQAPINAAIRAGGNAAIRGDSVSDAVEGTIRNPMQLIRALGFAGGGLIPGGVPDKVEAARMLASLPQEYRPMLSGIASNLMKG